MQNNDIIRELKALSQSPGWKLIVGELKTDIKKFEEELLTINAQSNEVLYTQHDLNRYVRAVMKDLIALPDTLISYNESAQEADATLEA